MPTGVFHDFHTQDGTFIHLRNLVAKYTIVRHKFDTLWLNSCQAR